MSDSHQSLSSSEDEEPFIEDSEKPSIRGVLSKWTNYIHGWQDRFVCCQDGTLFYYRTKDETEFGCRGTISLSKASVMTHEFDPCRFDVCINDSIWYLRASMDSEKQQWIDVIEANKMEAENLSLRRHGSLLSLGSGPSITSSSSFRKGHGLKEKLAELETFRDILDRQIDTLQNYFDACANIAQPKDIRDHWTGDKDIDPTFDHEGLSIDRFDNHVELKLPGNISGVDFKGEAITFKATTTGIQATLAHCIEMINKREEMWLKKLEREQERRRKAEEQYRISLAMAKKNLAFIGSPDYEEGPQSGLTEEEFFECVETELDRQERFSQDIERSRSLLREAEKQPRGHHRFSNEIDKRVKHHLADSLKPPGADDDKWELVAEEGEMKVYRKELIEDGLICDPLKALHSIKNVTAREMCHYFWLTDVRKEWEGTIENFSVVEVLDELTIVIYQTHRRIWPSAQRDCLYVSSMLKVDNPPPNGDGCKPYDTWMVCNFSVDLNEANPVAGCVRAQVEIALICQTYVTPPADGGPITRDCLKCDIVYVANVNPGGWVPASVLRSLTKREYPKFLRRFTAYVQEKTKEKEILI
ncbi:ceramide transfer protein-like [Clavelina lepadiformis]|uniref:ceramide transfer protein-like n=1 Tax=Clavelina lepadiformis TaxID=159417 RepID=UPI004043750E